MQRDLSTMTMDTLQALKMQIQARLTFRQKYLQCLTQQFGAIQILLKHQLTQQMMETHTQTKALEVLHIIQWQAGCLP